MQQPLYEQDLYAWAVHSARLVREGRFGELDAAHLAEELESMGKSELRALERRLAVLLAHLLKWEHQPDQRSKSWRRTIIEQRKRIERLLGDSPSLRTKLPTLLPDAYDSALRWAADESSLDEADFPQTCRYALERVLDLDYYPEPAPDQRRGDG